jgi:hypothetical protein
VGGQQIWGGGGRGERKEAVDLMPDQEQDAQ